MMNMIAPKVSLVSCKTYERREVESAVKSSVDLLGGVEAFVRPQESVLIKPNLLTDAKPEECVDTHPEVVRAVIRLLKPVTKKIYCGDSPGVWEGTKEITRVYEVSGIKEVCSQEGVELVYFNRVKMRGTYPLTDWLDKCDRLISVPKFKTHGFTVLTAGIKNLFGLVVGMSKIKIHGDNPRPDDLSRAVVDIYEAGRPDLTILDGITAIEGDGPTTSGNLKGIHLVASSPDALALDMVLSAIMNLRPQDIPTNREAIKRGLGVDDIRSIEILGEKLEYHIVRDFKLPKTSSLNQVPKWLIDIVKYFFRMKPAIQLEKCQVCGLCCKSCPVDAVSIKARRVYIDIKRCIFCLCCQENCPGRAIEVRKSFAWGVLAALRKLKG